MKRPGIRGVALVLRQAGMTDSVSLKRKRAVLRTGLDRVDPALIQAGSVGCRHGAGNKRF